jgi:IstB-like ATP binding protein
MRFKTQLARLDLLVLDELVYVPASKVVAELLFDVISTAYERTSLIVATNLPFEIPGPRCSARNGSQGPPSTDSLTGATSSRPGVRATGSTTPRPAAAGRSQTTSGSTQNRRRAREVQGPWTRERPTTSLQPPCCRFRPARAVQLNRRLRELLCHEESGDSRQPCSVPECCLLQLHAVVEVQALSRLQAPLGRAAVR